MIIRTATLQVLLQNKTFDEISLCISNFCNMVSEISSGEQVKIRTHRTVCEPITPSSYPGVLEKMDFFVRENTSSSTWAHCVPFDAVSLGNEGGDIDTKISELVSGDTFVNVGITDQEGGISLEASRFAAKKMKDISNTGPINNFRFGASMGSTDTPFFPFSSARNDLTFTVGLEMINVMVQVIHDNKRETLTTIREKILSSIRNESKQIEEMMLHYSQKYSINYGGIDFSIAPYPYPLEEQSVVTILEHLGNIGKSRGEQKYRFGDSGTLFLNSYLTSILKEISAEFKSTGFCGVMYSVLEDTLLSERYTEERYDTTLLKMLSTTCGCGIDMLPVPGTVSENYLCGEILDTASISTIVGKPLGVRILPIPGSKRGDITDFKHMFFTNTTIRDHNPGIATISLPNQDKKTSLRREE